MQTIIQKLDAYKTRAEVENLWTKTYFADSRMANSMVDHFNQKRFSVEQTVIKATPESYKSYGWD